MLIIRLFLRITIVFLISGFCSFLFAASSDNSIHPKTILENFWQEAKSNIYPKEREKKYFTDANYQFLEKKALEVSNIYELTPIINNFLEKLNVSHTHFFDNHSIDFYMFRSMFLTRDISLPEVNHIGAQYSILNSKYVVREILDGYPAASAGLRRGDILLKANGKPFHPYMSFNPAGKKVTLTVLRNKKKISLKIDSVNENPNLSYCNAMIQSKNTYEIDGKRIGYIHLWSGTHKNILKKFEKIIGNELHDTDGIILDLRGGFGGTWYEYLDPFYKNRKNYFEYTWIDRNGKTVLNGPESKTNKTFYSGPMVVLINEGVRSGKEALAYQFKKSNRAILIGTNTKGAFSVGRGIFNKKELPYFLYLATGELLLDQNRIEGIGIPPDIYVPYPLTENNAEDPQLKEAKLEIVKRIKAQS